MKSSAPRRLLDLFRKARRNRLRKKPLAGFRPQLESLEDRTAPASHADLYAHAIPHAQLRLLPGRDHQLNGDMRDVAEALRRSLLI